MYSHSEHAVPPKISFMFKWLSYSIKTVYSTSFSDNAEYLHLNGLLIFPLYG